MNPWDICKLILLLGIPFSGRNLTSCETGGHKGYTGVRPGYRSEHRYEGRPGHIHRGHTSRGTHYGSRRFHQKLESPTDTSYYFPARPKERGYHQYGEGGKYKSAQSTSTAHGTLIDIDITNKRSTNKVKYYWDEKSRADVYTARDPYLIARVFKGEKVVWEAQNRRYPVMVSASVNERGKPKLTVLYPRDAIETRPKPNVTAPITSHSDQGGRCLEQSDDPELVILDIDLRHTLEYKYHWNKRDHLDVFTANYPFAFHSIVKGDRVLWRAKAGLYPVKVTVGVNKRGKPSLTVIYPGEQDHLHPPDRDRRHPKGVRPTRRTYRPTKPAMDHEPVILDIDLRHTLEYKYHWNKRDHLDVFTANYPFAFHSIVKGDRVLWRAKAGLYPVKVTVGINERGKPRLTVFYPEEAVHGPPTPLPRVKRPPTVPTPPVTERVEPSVTPVELDIENNKVTTNSFNYEMDDSFNTATYTCKAGHGFSSVRQGYKQIWKADTDTICTEATNVYANKVVTYPLGLSEKILIIYLMNGKTKRFTQSSVYCGLSSGEWYSTDVTKQKEMYEIGPKYHPKEVNITTKGSYKVNDITKYNVYKTEDQEVYSYIFKDVAKCTKITHDDKVVWKSDGSSTSCPEFLSYNRNDKTFVVHFGLDYIKFTLHTSGSWIGSQRFPIITIITEDSDGTIKENDPSKYRITKKGDMYTYSFNDGAKCTEIKYHFQVVWKFKGNPAELPKSLFIHTKARFFFIKSDKEYLLFMFTTKEGLWKSKPLKNMDKIVASDIKVLTKADSDSQWEEMPPSDYEFKNHDFCFEYRFKEGKKCYGLKKGDKSLYRYEEWDDYRRFPTTIYVLSDLSTFSVYPYTSFYSK